MGKRAPEDNSSRVVRFVNNCNTQAVNLNEQGIIRAMLSHSSYASPGGRIESIGQLADEAHISQSSISRFVRRMGYRSFADFKESYTREFGTVYRQREGVHRKLMGTRGMRAIPGLMHARAQQNLNSTMERMDWDALAQAVKTMADAHSVFIFGDDHVLSDFFTFQLDLLACGVPAFLHKNAEAQQMQAQALGPGDLVLFIALADDFVIDAHKAILEQAAATEGVILVGLCQDEGAEIRHFFDTYLCFGEPGAGNTGFSSAWLLSEIMSEMIYDV